MHETALYIVGDWMTYHKIEKYAEKKPLCYDEVVDTNHNIGLFCTPIPKK